MEFLSRVLKGLVVGVANIIPGVSGGTMAVVMGIYDRLIGAVSDLRRDFKNSLLYLFPIGIGAVLGIVLFSHLIKFLLEGYPMPTNLFFLGLILGSIPMIFRRARKESFQKSSLLPFAVSFAVMLLMTIFQNVSDASSALITTPHSHSSAAVGCGCGSLHDYAGHQRFDGHGAAGRLYLGVDCHLRPEHPAVASGGRGCAAGHLLWCKGNQLVHETL